MINDDEPVGTILCRRQVLRAAARAGAGLLAWNFLSPFARGDVATTQPKVDLVASPALTEGPFFVDEKLNRSNLLSDTTRASVLNGIPLALGLTIYQLADKKLVPMKNLQVDVWHCDAAGAYSDESNPMNHENTSTQKWLRGFQKTGDDGKVGFDTIIPGWYMGRTAHIHFKVRQFSTDGKTTADFTSQFFFSESDSARVFGQAPYNTHGGRRTTNEQDGIYSERLTDGTIAGSRLTLKLDEPAESKKGFASQFALVLTNESMHSGGGRDRGPGGGRRGGPPPGGGGFGGPGGPGGPGGGGPGGPPPQD